jgi:transposase
MRSIGLDVGRHVAEVAIAEPGLRTRSGGRIGASPESLEAFAATLSADDQVVLEATTNTWAIVELLERHAGRVVVSNPLRTRAIADAKTKTDTIDATTLAELLAADYLPTVWQPEPATRVLRRRVAARIALVAERTRLPNRIQAVLMRNLVSCPWSDAFGAGGRDWLGSVELPGDEREQVDRTLRLLEGLDAEIRLPRRASPAGWSRMGRVRHLLSIPGVGIQTAVGLVALIGHVHRFARPNKLVSYLGLDPRVHQSGGRPAYIGHISRAGQSHARRLLCEAAHAAIRVPGPLHAFYARVARRRGPGIAIIAVARKLAVLAWHLLSDEADYRWAPVGLTAEKIRAVERAAGAPRRPGGRMGISRTRAKAERERERQVPVGAEVAYVALVRARRERDAAAATGVRGEAKARARHDSAAESDPQTSALRHGVDRVRGNDTLGA